MHASDGTIAAYGEVWPRGDDRGFPVDSLHGRVDARLREMGETMRRYGRRPARSNAAKEPAHGAEEHDGEEEKPAPERPKRA